jgi:hypothetical protein
MTIEKADKLMKKRRANQTKAEFDKYRSYPVKTAQQNHFLRKQRN